MPGLWLVRAALLVLSTLFGGLGIFFLYFSLTADLALGAYALVFLGAAAAIVWLSQNKNR
jgi:hypothetical protein